MRYIFQKLVVIFSCCLLVLSPAGLGAMRAKNHSAHYFKQIRQLNKKSKQVLAYNQFLSQPCPIAIKQTYTFAKLKDQQKAPIQEKYRGQLVPVLSGCTSPLFAVLFASYFLVGQVNAQLPQPVRHAAEGVADIAMVQIHAQIQALNALNLANQQAAYFNAQQLKAQQEAEAQRLAQLKLQQELETQRVQMEQLKVQQKKHADEMLALEQKRLKEQKQLEELKKLEEQEAQQILKEEQKLEELKIKRLQEAKKVEEQKIKELRKEL